MIRTENAPEWQLGEGHSSRHPGELGEQPRSAQTAFQGAALPTGTSLGEISLPA